MPKHIIKNFKSLATTQLRKDALSILEEGMRSVNTKEVVKNHISLKGNKLKIGRKIFNLKQHDHIYVIGIGKASFEAAKALELTLGKRITDGIVLDIKAGKLKRIKTVVGSHPLPSASNIKATGEIIKILKQADSKDLILTVVSGGGSAMLCSPYKMSCDRLRLVTMLLMEKGARIDEINTVRKHLSEIQGGQFARLAYPATVVGLIFSDVPTDDLSVVASGPTYFDKTTVSDAHKILKKYSILKECKLSNCDLNKTPKDKLYFKKVYNSLVVDNNLALKAMSKKAIELGYKSKIFSSKISEEARKVGKELVQTSKKGQAIIAGGETTVKVKGRGKGGRNQELVLGALLKIKPGSLVVSFASDGVDNSNVAGAIADQNSKDKAKKLKLSVSKHLASNNSYPFFKKIGDHITTGLTGINISDLILVLQDKENYK